MSICDKISQNTEVLKSVVLGLNYMQKNVIIHTKTLINQIFTQIAIFFSNYSIIV